MFDELCQHGRGLEGVYCASRAHHVRRYDGVCAEATGAIKKLVP